MTVLLLLATRVSIAASGAAGASVSAAVLAPMASGPLGVGWWLALVLRRQRRRRWVAAKTSQDNADLAELTALGLTSGLGIYPALELAATTLGGPVGAEAGAVLERVKASGFGVFANAPGVGARLYRTLGRAAMSGAPLVESVTRLADRVNIEQAAALERNVRRLPIAMLFPLTLLILPGFVLLTVAPALLGAFGRLGF